MFQKKHYLVNYQDNTLSTLKKEKKRNLYDENKYFSRVCNRTCFDVVLLAERVHLFITLKLIVN